MIKRIWYRFFPKPAPPVSRATQQTIDALKQWEADYIRDKIYQSAKETHTDGRKLL